MKKKKIIIYSNEENENDYYNQLNLILGSEVDIVEQNIDKIADSLDVEAVLIPTYEIFDIIKTKIPSKCEIIKYNRTISKASITELEKLKKDKEYYLIDNTFEESKELVADIYQIGLKDLNIYPATVSAINKLVNKNIISTIHINEATASSILKIDTMIDISSIIEIGLRLNLEEHMKNIDLIGQLKESVTINTGLTKLLNRLNKYEKRLYILNHYIDEGYVEFDEFGNIEEINKAAERIFDIKMDDEENTVSINDFFSAEIVNMVYIQKKAIENQLIDITGNNIAVSIFPTVSSKKFYGASVVLKEYEKLSTLEKSMRKQMVKKGHIAKYTFEDIVGTSNAILECKKIAKRMALSNSSIVIEGETGTGKEVFAQAIHNGSSRKDNNFVAINCGALPDSILESELFGYEEGAFTGAKRGGKIGFFELAHNGTIFLDEIGEMSKHLQVKLLRVLQEKELMRVGGNEIINVDVRVIAASNINLLSLIKKNEFREDLYYRLRVLPLRIPPLRDRREDIKTLIESFKKSYKGKFEISQDAYKRLLAHEWNGNIRELKNCVEYFVNKGTEVITYGDIPMYIVEQLEESKEYNIRKPIEKDNVIELLKSEKNEYAFILGMLAEAYEKNEHIGRRVIYEEAQKNKLYLSEQHIRKMLKELETYGTVIVGKGRFGCKITNYGINIYEIIRSKQDA